MNTLYLKTLFIILFQLFSLAIWAYEPKVIAYRGCWDADEETPNSVQAMKQAASLGAWGCALDVLMTHDGVLVVNQDYSFHAQPICDTSWDELRKHRLLNGEPFPSLERFFEEKLLMGSFRLVIKMLPMKDKAMDTRAVEQLAALVKKYQFENEILLASTSRFICSEFVRLFVDPPVFLLGSSLAPLEMWKRRYTGFSSTIDGYDEQGAVLMRCKALKLKPMVEGVATPEALELVLAREIEYIFTQHPRLCLELIQP